MSMLEVLPVELFREITSCLTFLDKKALSITSKRCHTRAGHIECPDQLTWLIHLCRCPAKFHGPLFENPTVFRDLIFNVHGNLVYKYSPMIATSIKVDIEELVSPYFLKAFPESTLVHYYMTVAQNFASSAVQTSDATSSDNAPLSPKYYWGRIESEAAYVIKWLEQQKPTEVHCWKAVPRISFSRIDRCRRRA